MKYKTIKSIKPKTMMKGTSKKKMISQTLGSLYGISPLFTFSASVYASYKHQTQMATPGIIKKRNPRGTAIKKPIPFQKRPLYICPNPVMKNDKINAKNGLLRCPVVFLS